MIAPRTPRPVPETNAISAQHDSRCLIFTGRDSARALNDPREISDLLQDEHNFVWFDLAEPTAADLALLRDEFSLHPTAVEDAALIHERPKIESYDGYKLVVLHAAALDAKGALVIHEIAVFAGKNFVVTIRAHPVYPLDEIERRWLERTDVPRDPTGLLYVILDDVVDHYGPIAAAFDERQVAIEETVLNRHAAARRHVLRDILALKRDLVRLRHAAAPVRDILAPLLRNELGTLDASLSAYFRDVNDHAMRVAEQIDAIRDLLNSTLDVHLSSEAHRQSEVSKQLTIIATIFLPLTYITGFFGQNFGWMVSHIESAPAFFWIGIGSQVVAVALLIGYFKRKGWF